MAQNIINDPDFKKLLPQMGEAQFPTLDAIGQQTAAEVNARPQPLSPAQFPTLNQLGQEGLAEAFPTPDTAFGTEFNPNVTKPVANMGTPMEGASQFNVPDPAQGNGQITGAGSLSNFMAGLNEQAGLPRTQMPAAQMATPESVAGLSIAGEPMTPETITGAGTPPSGITKDGVFYPTQQPTGELKTYEDQLKGTIAAGEMTPQMKAQAASEASPSASPEQVALAQQEAATRQANIEADAAAKEYGDTLKLDGGTIAAREAKIAEFRQDFVDKQKPAEVKTPEDIRSEQVKAQEDEKRLQLLDQKIEAGKSPDATTETKKAAARAQGVKDGTITQAQADEATKQDLIGKPPMGYATWAEYESSTGTDADGDGKVSTPAEAAAATPSDGGSTPTASIPTVNTQAEYDALPSGSQYIDSKGNQATKK